MDSYSLPRYDFNALEPAISAEIMKIHHQVTIPQFLTPSAINCTITKTWCS